MTGGGPHLDAWFEILTEEGEGGGQGLASSVILLISSMNELVRRTI